ncbi:MAG: DNA integrity scanning protein DisA nucleotide-binding domain protein [Thermoplasmatota archaeon]
MTKFVDSVMKIKSDIDPTKVLLFTDKKDLMEELAKEIRDVPLIISTQHPPLSSFLGRSNVRLRRLQHPPKIGLDVLGQGKDIVLSCAAEGILDRDDHVLFIISSDIESIFSFDMSEIGVVNLKEEVEGRIDLDVLESAFNVSANIVREGKEGLPAGALLILGDSNKVINNTSESVRNPLEGCAKDDLNIKNEDNWNTIKEFSMLDGALVLDKFGNPIAAGRYVMFNNGNEGLIEEGLGGRHLAASSITNQTRAIAIVASSEGAIRIYKDGERIYTVEGV